MSDGQFSTCWKCKSRFFIPSELYAAARASSAITIHCAYGHPGVFSEGETEADKLRRERDLLAQKIAQKDDTIKFLREAKDTAQRSASAQKGLVTRIKNRVGSGVCPCCNRSFENLRRHIASKHPQFKAEEVAA